MNQKRAALFWGVRQQLEKHLAKRIETLYYYKSTLQNFSTRFGAIKVVCKKRPIAFAKRKKVAIRSHAGVFKGPKLHDPFQPSVVRGMNGEAKVYELAVDLVPNQG